MQTGERWWVKRFCLYAKHLAPIRKTPCAYTQNLLALTQKQSFFFRVYLLLVMVGLSFNNGTGAIDLFCEDESDHLV